MASPNQPAWSHVVAMAKPLFGTTATHAACLFVAWGDDKAKADGAGTKNSPSA